MNLTSVYGSLKSDVNDDVRGQTKGFFSSKGVGFRLRKHQSPQKTISLSFPNGQKRRTRRKGKKRSWWWVDWTGQLIRKKKRENLRMKWTSFGVVDIDIHFIFRLLVRAMSNVIATQPVSLFGFNLHSSYFSFLAISLMPTQRPKAHDGWIFDPNNLYHFIFWPKWKLLYRIKELHPVCGWGDWWIGLALPPGPIKSCLTGQETRRLQKD